MSYIKYPKPTPEQAMAMGSEIEKYRHLISEYLPYDRGVIVDVGTQGVTAVPFAVSFDLPEIEARKYANGNPDKGPVQMRGHLGNLPFEHKSIFGFVLSHIIEDWPQSEWKALIDHVASRVISGGVIVVLIPDHERWWAQVTQGRCHNHAHAQPQPNLGDLTKIAATCGLRCEIERYTDVFPGDSTILGVLRVP